MESCINHVEAQLVEVPWMESCINHVEAQLVEET
jgi:hypothetical protein